MGTVSPAWLSPKGGLVSAPYPPLWLCPRASSSIRAQRGAVPCLLLLFGQSYPNSGGPRAFRAPWRERRPHGEALGSGKELAGLWRGGEQGLGARPAACTAWLDREPSLGTLISPGSAANAIKGFSHPPLGAH